VEGIILIIVFAVIANIVRAINARKGAYGQPGRTPAEIFKELRERDSGAASVHQPGTQTSTGTGSQSVNAPGMSGMDSRYIRRQRGQYEPRTYSAQDSGSAAAAAIGSAAISKPMQTARAKSQSVKHKLSFSRDSMLNGIILSEVLGPPKGRRR